MAHSITQYFSNKNNLIIINRCFEFGVVFSQIIQNSNILINKTFVITGTLPSMSRKEAKDIIIDNGGRVNSSISKNTDFLLHGDNPGSKYNKALNLGIDIIDEDTFKNMFNG